MGGRIVKQWKEKLNIWGKWVGMTGVAIWVIFSLFDSKSAGYSTIEVLVLFSVLFFGYRYGKTQRHGGGKAHPRHRRAHGDRFCHAHGKVRHQRV